GGGIALMAATMVLFYFSGFPLSAFMEGTFAVEDLTVNSIRVMLMLQHLLLFIAPAILSTYVLSRSNTFRDLDMDRQPVFRHVLLRTALLISALPLVAVSMLLNDLIPLPDWAIGMETDANDTLKAILGMPHLGYLVINIFLIAILPGIGEELV